MSYMLGGIRQKESEVLRDCISWLYVNGIFCWRNNTGSCKQGNRYIRFGLKGSADIIGLLPDGRFLAVECKREEGGRLSDAQKKFAEKIRQNKGIYIVANSLDNLIEKIKQNY